MSWNIFYVNIGMIFHVDDMSTLLHVDDSPGCRQKYLPLLPLHAHVFSFTYSAVVLSGFECVHPKNKTKIL